MPIYEFSCAKCGLSFEKLVMGFDNGSITCPDCGSSDVKKLFSSFGFSSSGKTISTGACSSCSTTSNCASCGK
ncbi:MAG: zinc ribbon domain-containing protein [Actinomycetota bacterium]|nr:zinc ribbon domain-containing protein [Actinomycetota bacterium]